MSFRKLLGSTGKFVWNGARYKRATVLTAGTAAIFGVNIITNDKDNKPLSMTDKAKELMEKAKHSIVAKKEEVQGDLEDAKSKAAHQVSEKSKDLEDMAADKSVDYSQQSKMHKTKAEQARANRDAIDGEMQRRDEQERIDRVNEGGTSKDRYVINSRREARARLYGSTDAEEGPTNSSLKGQQPPGEASSIKKVVLEGGATILQKFPALKDVSLVLCDIGWYGHDVNRQVEQHLYCSRLNDDFHQCIMFDEDGPKPRFIGVKYIISENLFSMLPEEEKKLWHSNKYNVESGILAIPRGVQLVENSLLKDLVNTYGKTLITWQVDAGDSLPLGVPQLLMSFTEDGQVTAPVLDKRDRHLVNSTLERRKQRFGTVQGHEVLPGANAWETGEVNQISLVSLSHD